MLAYIPELSAASLARPRYWGVRRHRPSSHFAFLQSRAPLARPRVRTAGKEGSYRQMGKME